ncbi:MAG: 3-phosphoshikimate 1-carboxyvinyltransferase [Muribaculaceae bacterium]|nr:3-phosphoshikimate 1-carboxyvinyltransferase [Muribaculaceae bacterium]
MDYKIYPPEELTERAVKLPLSKSESNRALIISALTAGAELPRQVADCDDTDVMLAALERTSGPVNIGAAGTAMRFLTAYYAVTPGAQVTLDGSERMRQRPIGQLVDALRSLGADIEYLGKEGFPPLEIKGRMLEGGEVEIPASVSSQFISALLMVGPTMTKGLTLRLTGRIISRPYIYMTLEMMEQAGAKVNFDENAQTITVEPGKYTLPLPPVEADWSAASYWFEIAAISAEPVALEGLRMKSLQGDSAVKDLFKVTGLETSWDGGLLNLQLTPDAGARLELDLTDTPDLTQTLAVTCCMLGLPFRFTGVESLKIKETDRLGALQMELSKLGFILDVEDPGIILWRGARYEPEGEEIEPIQTYDDHRMAMAFAPAAIFFPGLRINDCEVVSKSYPRFWNDLRAAGFTLEEVEKPMPDDD